MSEKPVAAGKSSLDLIDQELAFSHIVTKSDAVYLDLACGVGRYSLTLAERMGKESVIHALDLWEDGIAALKESAKSLGYADIKAEVADITRPLPLRNNSIDVCFIATALHDLPIDTRGAVVGEIHRVLADRGVFVLIEFKKLDHGPGPSQKLRIGEEDADALVIPYGFTKEVSVDLGEFTYLTKYKRTSSSKRISTR